MPTKTDKLHKKPNNRNNEFSPAFAQREAEYSVLVHSDAEVIRLIGADDRTNWEDFSVHQDTE
jgi:hypothetical protein